LHSTRCGIRRLGHYQEHIIMRQKVLVSSLIGIGVMCGALGGFAMTGAQNVRAALTPEPPAVVAQAQVQTTAPYIPPRAQAYAAVALPDFTSIVAQNGPAVVNISVTEKAEKTGFSFGSQGLPNMGPNDPFSQFFRQFQNQRPQNEAPAHGMGSGFIISPDGIVLTNAHVVDGSTEVIVKLTDQREFKAKVLGSDRASDVAVLKIDAKDLPVVRLATNDDVKVGEWVLAIGSPFGFENTATSGIVSAKSRSLPDENYTPFIQTDVAVNPGNSGGPLFNMKGEVIGINSQIYSRSGGYQGLSFAIPMNVVLGVKDQLIQHGSVSRGRIGVAIQGVNAGLAESFGMKRATGALVSSVEDGGPADKAGIKAGDVILKFNGKEIARSADLPLLVSSTAPGTTARLEILRDGASRTVDVTVTKLKNDKVAANDNGSESHGRLGVEVRKLNPDEQKEAGVHGGLLVENASGPAASAGIQPGDVILSINGAPVNTGEQLKSLLAKSGRHIALLIQRDDQKVFVPVDLG
jgi:serine protease Do